MTTTKPLPSLEYLQECFELSEESPSGLVWKVRPREHFRTGAGWISFTTQCAGKNAGTPFTCKKGHSYFSVNILQTPYLAHRIVVSLLNNKLVSVSEEVDHVDGNGLKNTRNNLRVALKEQNQHNAKIRVDNSSGVKGVSWHKASKSWMYRVCFNGKRHYGLAPTLEKASCLIQELRSDLHKDFCHHGK